MNQQYVQSVELMVPSGSRLATVTPDWGIEVNGCADNNYTTEDALVFAALCKLADQVQVIDAYLQQVVTTVYGEARDAGAKELMLMESQVSTIGKYAIKYNILRLLRNNLGPISTNLYILGRSNPSSILLCTDVTSPKYGRDILCKSKSADKMPLFLAQYERRIKEEAMPVAHKKRHYLVTSTDAATDAPQQTTAPSRPAKSMPKLRYPIPAESKYSEEELHAMTVRTAEKLLYGEPGVELDMTTLFKDLVADGATRVLASKVEDTLDRFVRAGYLLKQVTKDYPHNIVYVRTDVILRHVEAGPKGLKK